MTRSDPRVDSSISGDASEEPLSTATTPSRGCVWRDSAMSPCRNQLAPLRTTRTTRTLGAWPRSLILDWAGVVDAFGMRKAGRNSWGKGVREHNTRASPEKRGRGACAPLPGYCTSTRRSYRDFRAVLFRAVLFLAVVLRAGLLRAVDFRAVLLRAVLLRAVDFLAVLLRALVVAAFLAVDFLAADFLALVVAAFRAVVFFLAVDFLATGMGSPPLQDQDAMRFRRLRSRSLIPPHTPYRSSRRRA